MKKIWMGLLLVGLAGSTAAGELDELLRQVQESRAQESRIDAERRSHFLADRNQQQKLLNETKAALARAEADSKALRAEFAANQARLTELGAEVKKQSGDLADLFDSARQFAGTLKAGVADSLVSAQFPGRTEALETLSNGKELPTIPQLENLWVTALQEMTGSGRVVRYSGKVTDAAGVERNTEVYRIGEFTALADGQYLRYIPEHGQLMELPRQPDRGFLSLAKNVGTGNGPFVEVAIDPTRGSVLDGLAQAPASRSWLPKELTAFLTRGVDVGIIGLLLLASVWAVAVAIERWLFYRQVDVSRYPNRAALETELSRHLTVVGTVAANAPYVGLLGTVVGIMLTFYRMGMDKAMDVHHIMIGLSLALKATAMGLVVAIPCVVLNNVLRRRIRELVTAYEVRHGS